MTIQQRQQQLRAAIRPGTLAEQVERSRQERLHPGQRTSRKQIAKLRRMISELDDEQLAALEQEIEK